MIDNDLHKNYVEIPLEKLDSLKKICQEIDPRKDVYDGHFVLNLYNLVDDLVSEIHTYKSLYDIRKEAQEDYVKLQNYYKTGAL